MGSTTSKEEVIIAQAGNSGGSTTSTTDGKKYDLIEVGLLIAGFLVVAVILRCLFMWGKRSLHRIVRNEIVRSRDQLAKIETNV